MRHQSVPTGQILEGDARSVLGKLPAESIDCVVTSPPYFQLRNYGHGNQIGLERNVTQWVNELTIAMRGVKRVLKTSGALWLNLGDTFSRHVAGGATPKCLVMAPERLALAMVEDGWILRNKVVWAKSNPMPTSVRDRLSCTWEVVYFFTKSEQYYFDLDAIRVPHRSKRSGVRRMERRQWSVPNEWRGPSTGTNTGLDRLRAVGHAGHPMGKNPGDVWTLPTAGYRGAHHAVYPKAIVERPPLATCPEQVCAGCGAPWVRAKSSSGHAPHAVPSLTQRCACIRSGTRPGIVLDPFIGSGTTAIVAEAHARQWVGVEVNPKLAELARRRIETERPRRDAEAGDALAA